MCSKIPRYARDKFLKTIFFGTPEFAKIILEKLIQDKNLEILALVCAPDKPVGRKQILTSPPVKILAEKNDIPVLQPEKLDKKFIAKLKNINPDLNIIAAYGKILPLEILEIPKYKSINTHPSLLPKYRGTSPIQTAILNGDSETGVTIMLMDEKMDHGSIISKIQFPISNTYNYKILSEKLANASAELLIKTIPDYISGKIKPAEQNHNNATFCKIIKKQDGGINWHKSAQEIYNQYRAFVEWPGIFSELIIYNKKLIVKFIEINLTDKKSNNLIGEFFIENKKLFINCGDNNLLEIKKLQPQGKKNMTADAFINGYLS